MLVKYMLLTWEFAEAAAGEEEKREERGRMAATAAAAAAAAVEWGAAHNALRRQHQHQP